MSMQSVGKVIKLFISKQGSSLREEKDNYALDTHGILKDKYYNTNPQRSVLISSLTSYTLASTKGIDLNFGLLGENILLDYNPYKLPAGTQLFIGSTVLEISQNCTICNHLSQIDERLPTLLEHDRGIFVKVIKKGCIKKGDIVYLR